MEALYRHLISPSLWQHKHTSQSLPKLSELRTRAFRLQLFWFIGVGGFGGCLSPVFWQCEQLPLALLWGATRILCTVLVSMETTRIPTGTAVFLYAVGYSLSKASCCDSGSTAQSRRYSILPTAQCDQDNVKYSSSHPEIQSGKHTVPELCTYIKQHWQVPNWTLKPQMDIFSQRTSSAAVCAQTQSKSF